MKKSKFLLLFLTAVLLFSILPMQALAVEAPAITAASAILLNADDGEVFFEQNADEHRDIASTTKIMTALLVIEAVEDGQFSMEDSVAAYADCQEGMDEDSSNANPAIQPDEVLSVRDLLYCAMLASANEACNILAEYTAGSISAFVSQMNDRAAELGCTDTHFKNPSGLEESKHYSTARDLAIIARECVSHEQFVQICCSTEYTVDATNLSESRSLKNSNAMVMPNSDYYNADVYGLKTGYLESAGACLVAAIEKDDINLIGVVLGDTKTETADNRYVDMQTLFDWFYDNYSYLEILSSTESVIKVPVALATEETVSGRPETSVNVLLPNDFDLESVDYEYVVYSERDNNELIAPVNAGTVLGEVTVSAGDRVFGTVNLVATNTAELSKGIYLKNSLKSILQQPIVRKLLIVLILVVAIYIILSFFYLVQHSRHNRSVRRARQNQAEYQAIRESFPEVEIHRDRQDEEDEELPDGKAVLGGVFSRVKNALSFQNSREDDYGEDESNGKNR